MSAPARNPLTVCAAAARRPTGTERLAPTSASGPSTGRTGLVACWPTGCAHRVSSRDPRRRSLGPSPVRAPAAPSPGPRAQDAPSPALSPARPRKPALTSGCGTARPHPAGVSLFSCCTCPPRTGPVADVQ